MTANGKQNAFVFYVRTLIYTLMALGLRLIAAAPLTCLFVFDDWKRWLAALCPVMVILGLLPLRYSFAQAMTAKPRHFSFDTAFSFSHYGEKLREALIHDLHVIKWGIPLAIMLAAAGYAYTQVDALTLFQTINDLGNFCGEALAKAAGWLAGLTGADSVAVVTNANNFMLGVMAVAAVFGLGVLIWLWGAVRNSASRYIWAVAASTDRVPHAEMRRRLQGRRLKQLGLAILNLILWIPFLYVSAGALKGAVSDASTMIMMAITTGQLPTADLVAAAVPVAGAFALLYLPLVPLRRWNTAAFAARKPRIKAEKKVSA